MIVIPNESCSEENNRSASAGPHVKLVYELSRCRKSFLRTHLVNGQPLARAAGKRQRAKVDGPGRGVTSPRRGGQDGQIRTIADDFFLPQSTLVGILTNQGRM